MIDSFTALCTIFPSFFGLEIFLPKGEGAALFGTGFVNHTHVVSKKDALIGAWIFFERKLAIDLACVGLDELFDCDTKRLGHGFDLFLIDPYVSRLSGAALATSGTGEIQAFFVPRFGHRLKLWVSDFFHSSP